MGKYILLPALGSDFLRVWVKEDLKSGSHRSEGNALSRRPRNHRRKQNPLGAFVRNKPCDFHAKVAGLNFLTLKLMENISKPKACDDLH